MEPMGRRMLATVLVSATLPLAIGAQAPARTNEALSAEMDSYVSKAVKDWSAVGLSIAVVKDGRVVFSKGYGLRELDKPQPVDTSTLFAIASTTKAMTAAALAMLVDEGKVGWDDPVTKYLPSFQLYDPYATREITVRDLLTHRAGLGNADYLWAVSDLSAREMTDRLRLVKPAYSLRSGFIYQNIMYVAAGQVIAAASGMPWAKFVKTRLFEPIGMMSTVPITAEVPRGANTASPHFRYGGDTIGVIRRKDSEALGPAGGVWSNAADMSHWMRFLLDSGRANGKSLLKPATFAELFTPQTVVPPDEFYPTLELTRPHWMTYGLGWFQHDYQGRMIDFHTGSLDGMVAILGLVRDANFGVYVSSNVDHVEVRHALMYKAVDLYLGNPSRDWSTDLRALYGARRASADSSRKAREAMRIRGTNASLPLSGYVGVYEEPDFGKVRVSERSGVLRFDLGQALAGKMEHWQYDTFRVRYDERWQGNDLLSFMIGEGVASELRIGGVTLVRVPEKK